YAVKNTGTTVITGISVADNKVLPANLPCPGTPLAVGATATCTGTYTSTQADVDTGSVTNVASASGTDSAGNAVTSNTSTVTVPAGQSAALSVTKVASPTSFTGTAQSVTYTMVVTNTGNVTITGIGLNDVFSGSGTLSSITCGGNPLPIASLAAGAHSTCTATYSTLAGDVSTGHITNAVTASGTDSASNTVTSNTATATIPYSQITLVKTSTTASYSAAGQTISYSYAVKNTGTTVITGISVADNKVLPANLTCPGTPLAVGATATCTGTYTSTQADVDTGSVTNVASASGTDSAGNAVTSNTSTVTVPAVQSAALSVTKVASPTSFTG